MMLQTGLRLPAEGKVLPGPVQSSCGYLLFTVSCEMRDLSPSTTPPSSRESGQLPAPVDLCDPELSQEDSLAVA